MEEHLEEMPSEWHIAIVLEAITACCSNFVGKAGRLKLIIIVVGLLTLTEIVFETKTLVDARKRRDLLPGDGQWTDYRADDQFAFFDEYYYAFECCVAFYTLSTLAEIIYFAVWINIFYHKHCTPKQIHMMQIFKAVAFEMPLMVSNWCMLQALSGKVNYDDIFWDIILLVTFLVNAFLGMCFKLWDILSVIQEKNDWNSSFWLVKPVIVIILSCFHTIFLFTPIVFATENFSGIAHDKDTQNLMEIIRYFGQDKLTICLLFLVPTCFYGIYYVVRFCGFDVPGFDLCFLYFTTCDDDDD